MSARDLPEAILWHEGMMLAPQHFQQQTARFDQLLAYHLRLASPYHWGVVHLEFDRVALVSGVIRLIELEAVLPDGLVVHHTVERPLLKDRVITEYAAAGSQTVLTLHLAVPVGRAMAEEATSSGELARYHSVEGGSVGDESGGDSEVRIPRRRPNLTLLVTAGVSQQPSQKYVTMPIAQLVYQNEAFTLTGFVPPTLRVTEQSALGKLAADIARRARAKALYLSERAGSGSGSAANQPMIQDTMAEIQGLVVGLPVLEALIASGSSHPFQLYLALCNYIGHLAAFASGTVPPVLSRYDHNNPMIAFGEIRDYSLRMLDRVKESFIGLPFSFENGKFVLALEEAWLTRRLVIGVRGPVGMSEADLVTWIQNSLIASRSHIEALWEMRVMGAGRRVIEGDKDMDLVPTRGAVLFAVDNDAQYIKPGEVLEIWNADARANRLRPAEIVLYVKAAG